MESTIRWPETTVLSVGGPKQAPQASAFPVHDTDAPRTSAPRRGAKQRKFFMLVLLAADGYFFANSHCLMRADGGARERGSTRPAAEPRAPSLLLGQAFPRRPRSRRRRSSST